MKVNMNSFGNMRKATEAEIAMAKFDSGPPKATIALSRRGFLKLSGFMGVGLAQPNIRPANRNDRIGTSTVPSGSMWAEGFSVIRPMRRAVGSPNLLAKKA